MEEKDAKMEENQKEKGVGEEEEEEQEAEEEEEDAQHGWHTRPFDERHRWQEDVRGYERGFGGGGGGWGGGVTRLHAL